MANVYAELGRKVLFAPGYFVTKTGQVISTQRGRPRVLKQRVGYGGYRYTFLYVNGRQHTIAVHRLVLLVYRGPCPAGQETRHMDGDRSNNALRNLRWGTRKSNMADRVRHGTVLRGEQIRQSKLTETQIREIRQRRRRGEKLGVLARAFGVTTPTIWYICAGRLWRHVK